MLRYAWNEFWKFLRENVEAVIQGIGLAIASAAFFVTVRLAPQYTDFALVSFLLVVCGFFIWVAISIKNRLAEHKSEFAHVTNYVDQLSSNVVQGGRLATIDELFRFLCEARTRTQNSIRLMKIRGNPPVDIVDNEVVIESRRGKVLKPKYTYNSEPMEQWYEQLGDWAAEPNRQIQRITLWQGDIGEYARFVMEQMEVKKAAWTTYYLNNPQLGLPPYNLCIFDDREMTLTIGNPNRDGDTTIWINDQELVRFFIGNFDDIKNHYTTEHLALLQQQQRIHNQ